MNQLDRVVFPTRVMGKILIENGLSPEIMNYSQYGINLKNIKRDSKKSLAGIFRLGFMGTLYEHKGPQVLVKAMGSLSDCKDIELKIWQA